MKNNWLIAGVLIAPIFITGCATPKQFDVSESKVWSLQDAPNLSDVISVPISNVIEVSEKISTQHFNATRKEKFETDAVYKARLEGLPKGYGNEFFVKKLSTYGCTNYDFQKGIYNIKCKVFRANEELDSKTKETGGKTQLSNAYTTREIVFFENNTYYISLTADATANLKISAEDAKKIDRDMMFGIVISINSSDYDLGGCSETDVTYDQVCKSVAFKSGSAYRTRKYKIVPGAILETVIYLKSSNKVLVHEKYSLSK